MNLWPKPNYPQVLKVKKRKIKKPIILAGMCFAEQKYLEQTAKFLKSFDITYMRGGVFRAGTYPPKEFGLNKKALADFSYHAHKNGLRIIIEILDIRDIEFVSQFADALQIGARHSQDYSLLKEVKQFNGDITIKRGLGQTLDEFLGSVEYLMGGNCKPIMIERGGSTYHNHVRWDLSISLIAAIKKMTGVPIIVDASHGTGRADLVEPMTMAGIAAGADGYLAEVHPAPEKSLSDPLQAIDFKQFKDLYSKAKYIYNYKRKLKEEMEETKIVFKENKQLHLENEKLIKKLKKRGIK
ncbi:MAG: hypothetical protein KAJ48_07965 [Elusimicrobiales bacterium]|nr:hypothetical protein [Elusimicrobiales bacterium]